MLQRSVNYVILIILIQINNNNKPGNSNWKSKVSL